MKRVRSFQAAVLTSMFLVSAGVAPADNPELIGPIEIPPVTHDRTVLPLLGGWTLNAGEYGGQHLACEAPGRAFLELEDPTGRHGWHRVRQATPAGGACGDPAGLPLFDDFTLFDSAHILDSSIRDATVDEATGEIYTLVDLRLAWTIAAAPGLDSARGIALLHWAPDGTLLHQRYLGSLPDGPPPVSVNCLGLCDVLGNHDDNVGFRGHRVVGHASGVTVTGLYHSPDGRTPSDLLVARFNPDLTDQWVALGGTAGHDEGLDLAVDSVGRTYVVGFGQSDPDRNDRDPLVLRIDPGGRIDRLITFAGDRDGEAQRLAINADGTITTYGTFTGEMTVGHQPLGNGSAGQQTFGAELDEELEPLSAWIAQPNPEGVPIKGTGFNPSEEGSHLAILGGKTAPFNKSEEGSHLAILEAYEVTHGQEVAGGIEQLLASDNDYLRIVSRAGDYVELRGFFDPDPQHEHALHLKTVSWELKTRSCYRTRIFFRKRQVGEPLGEPLLGGERRICPSHARGRLWVKPEMAGALGYDGETEVPLDELLEVIFTFVFEDSQLPPPAGGLIFKDASGGAKDSSVDEVQVEIEY